MGIELGDLHLGDLQNATGALSSGQPPQQLPQQLVSDYVHETTSFYVGTVTASCSAIGVCGNIVNTFVFYKLGLKRPSNICFFSLAIADLVSLSWIFVLVLAENRFVEDGRWLVPLLDVAIILSPVSNSLTAFAAWVTTVISIERFCCIVFPLKVKNIFTKRVTPTLLLWMLFYQVVTAAPFYFSFRLIRVTSPLTGWSRMVVDRANQNRALAVLSKTISFSVPTVVCFVVVAIATIFLLKSFRRSRETRQAMGGSKPEERSAKDARIVKTVVIICIVFIVGFFVKVTNFLISMVYPAYHVFDPYLGNVCAISSNFANLFQAISCSVNIFVYYRMNYAFRQRVKDAFCCRNDS